MNLATSTKPTQVVATMGFAIESRKSHPSRTTRFGRESKNIGRGISPYTEGHPTTVAIRRREGAQIASTDRNKQPPLANVTSRISTHQRQQHTARSNQIWRNITFTCSSLVLDAPPECGGPYVFQFQDVAVVSPSRKRD